MRVIHVVPRIANRSSGPSYSVTRLAESLPRSGCDARLYVLEPRPDSPPAVPLNVFPTVRIPGAWRLGWSPSMKRALFDAAGQADIIHNHSMWMMPNIYCYPAARKHDRKLVFSPRGTLASWSLSRSRGRKRLVWLMGQKSALYGADCLHATSDKELEEIRAFGMRQPVTVIPNGIDLPDISVSKKREDRERIMLFLSRMHPTKNLDLLLRAWRGVETRFPHWKLVVAGPLEGRYPASIQQLASSLKLERIEFPGEVRGRRKTDLLTSADVFVLPTRTENFGMAVAEALSHGLPVIVTRGAPWKHVETHRCGWWIEPREEELVATMSAAMGLDDEERLRMGMAGRTWMEREFSWHTIAGKMHATYRWLMGMDGVPEFVHER